jgi:hypothetical protein
MAWHFTHWFAEGPAFTHAASFQVGDAGASVPWSGAAFEWQ